MTDVQSPDPDLPTTGGPPKGSTGLGMMVWCDSINTVEHPSVNGTDPFSEAFACVRLEHGGDVRHKASRREPPCPGCGGHDDHSPSCPRPPMPSQSEVDFEW